MAFAAATHPDPATGSASLYGCFDPDDIDAVGAAMAQAETLVDQHQVVKDFPQISRLARNPNKSGAMAAFMVIRHRMGLDTTRDHLLMVGWTNTEIERHHGDALALALHDLQDDRADGDEEERREAQALAECGACVHAGGEG